MKLATRLATVLALVSVPLPALADTLHGVMYRDPSCTCCETYAAYLKQNGIDVELKPSLNLAQISQDAGVPTSVQGCHAIMLNGYVVEGLVPIGAIQKMLKEQPKITGIALAGMPMGSPGMGGTKTEPLTVYAFTKGSTATPVYETE